MTDRRRRSVEPTPRVQLNLHVSPQEKLEFQTRAREAGLDTVGFIRKQCLGSAGYRSARVPPVEMVELRRCMMDMGRISLNLHGLYRIAQLGEIPAEAELKLACAEHCAMLSRLMKALGREG